MKKRKIMRAFKIDEISGVDRPAQAGATVTIMKRDSTPCEQARRPGHDDDERRQRPPTRHHGRTGPGGRRVALGPRGLCDVRRRRIRPRPPDRHRRGRKLHGRNGEWTYPRNREPRRLARGHREKRPQPGGRHDGEAAEGSDQGTGESERTAPEDQRPRSRGPGPLRQPRPEGRPGQLPGDVGRRPRHRDPEGQGRGPRGLHHRLRSRDPQVRRQAGRDAGPEERRAGEGSHHAPEGHGGHRAAEARREPS